MQLQKTISKVLLNTLAVGMALSSLTHAQSAFTYSDVKQNAWYYSAVSKLTNYGVLSGYTDGTFRPQSDVTMGEALKLILVAAGHGEQQKTGSHWASGYLSKARQLGILNNQHAGDLDAPITRGEVAKLLVEALGIGTTSETGPFSDTTDPYVNTLYLAGFVSGSVEQGSRVYRPNDTMSRAELCSMIGRMYHEEQFQFGSYWVDVAPNLPKNTYDPAAFRKSSGIMTYDGLNTAAGIDVSYYQEDIDWVKVKQAGIDYVMIRLGYRGYESGKLVLDSRFKEYIKGASEAGLDIGIYFFSQAITTQEAREEAEFVLENLGKYDITYPVVFDWEVIGVKPARTDELDKQTLTDCAKVFCDIVAEAGYIPAIYYTKYLGYVCYDMSQLSAYDIWFAEYKDTPSFYYSFDMWQYTDSGNIPGISVPVDVNICFKNYS